MPNMTADTVARILMSEWISRWGPPFEIHSDQGTQFTSEVFQTLCALLGIDKSKTVLRNPASDGICERFNRTMQQVLSTLMLENPWDWDELLPFVTMAFRSAKSSATGYTPNFLLFGRENSLPIEAFAPDTPEGSFFTAPEYVQHVRMMLKKAHAATMENLQLAISYQERSYRNRLKAHQYALRDAVWYWRPVFKKGQCPKLLSFWTGPYFVVEIKSDVLYRIQNVAKSKSLVVHHNHLKPAYLREAMAEEWLDDAVVKYQTQKIQLQDDYKLPEKLRDTRKSQRERKPPDRFDSRISDPALLL